MCLAGGAGVLRVGMVSLLVAAAACTEPGRVAPAASGGAATTSAPSGGAPEATGRARAWPGPERSATFPAAGVRRVVLRAGRANDAKVERSSDGAISVRGRPVLVGLEGTPSARAFDDTGFASMSFDDTLLVATSGEFFYIHFGATMRDVVLSVPAGIDVVREDMRINGDTKPDLRPPGSPPRPEGR